MARPPKLPLTIAEAEASLLEADALAYARELVCMVRDEQVSFCGLQLSWFEKPESQRFARWLAKQMSQTPQGMIDLCNLARAGWGLADEAARELIQHYKHHRRYEEMPPSLLAYDQEITGPRRAYRQLSAPKKEDRFLRDLAICVIVGAVCGRFGLNPTRQRASKRERPRPSGCSTVALALKAERMALGESAVAEAWRRFGRMAFPDGPHAIGVQRFGRAATG